ncbi:hypothetical protein BC941DRAFT_518388 [Chlamydoabsidia padenii]|nr:hypothetical protein BC941DRAFT_518388 [Chlamydoabsidia padenii]
MTFDKTERKHSNMGNNQSPTLREHAPAQMVGGMRVRQNHRRSSFGKQGQEESNHEQTSTEEQEQERMNEKEKQRQEQVHNENAMRAQQAARDFNISRNAGSHVHARIDPSFQPRDLNH